MDCYLLFPVVSVRLLIVSEHRWLTPDVKHYSIAYFDRILPRLKWRSKKGHGALVLCRCRNTWHVMSPTPEVLCCSTSNTILSAIEICTQRNNVPCLPGTATVGTFRKSACTTLSHDDNISNLMGVIVESHMKDET